MSLRAASSSACSRSGRRRVRLSPGPAPALRSTSARGRLEVGELWRREVNKIGHPAPLSRVSQVAMPAFYASPNYHKGCSTREAWRSRLTRWWLTWVRRAPESVPWQPCPGRWWPSHRSRPPALHLLHHFSQSSGQIGFTCRAINACVPSYTESVCQSFQFTSRLLSKQAELLSLTPHSAISSWNWHLEKIQSKCQPTVGGPTGSNPPKKQKVCGSKTKAKTSLGKVAASSRHFLYHSRCSRAIFAAGQKATIGLVKETF